MIDFEQMLSLMERIDPQYRQTKQLINEGKETKNMSSAKQYLYDKMGYDEKKALDLIGKIKHDIPNSRLGKCKFMLGLVRMYCNRQINNGDVISKLNQTLEYAASDKYINNFDQDLNGLSASELIGQFEDIISQDLMSRKDKMSQQQHIANNNYNIVKIDSFDEASQYSEYCDWCVTGDESSFDTYTSDDINQFYFCLRNGFESKQRIEGEGCPLDSYGLSMIAVSIRPDGSINTCTCRWNHDNGGNDHIMNDEQLSKLLGVNIYNVLKPKEFNIVSLIENGYSEDEINLSDIVVGDFVIPDGVRQIGVAAFLECEKLTSITIPNSVTSIGDYAFTACKNLTSVTIGNSVTTIGEQTFMYCYGLTSVTIPNSVTSIGRSAFYCCDSLTSVTIGNSVTTIGDFAFNGCSSITSITIPNSVIKIGYGAFNYCKSLTSVTIGNSVTSIGENAFSYCKSLTSITIPNSVTSIGHDAFNACDNLTIYVQSEETAILVRQSRFRGNIRYINN